MTDLRRPDARGSAEDESWDALVEARQRLLARVDRRRWRGRVLALASMVLLAAVGHGGVQGVAAGADLFEARAQLGRAVSALQGADAHEALEGFSAAQARGAAARDRLTSPSLRALAAVPVLGRTVQATEAVAHGATLTAEAGAELAVAALALPEGLGALAPRDGQIPIGALAQAAPALERAHVLIAAASEVVAGSPGTWVLGPVGRARHELAAELGRVEPALHTAAVLASARSTSR